jgi:CO/xanthine dehydrogenase Mo-binding subunit
MSTHAPESIGTPTPRADGVEKVTGAALYASDVRLPGTLWGKTLRSPYAHARIVAIDTSKATTVPGVHAVLTGSDLGNATYGRRIVDVPVLARGVVRFVGEQVAAVAADDEDIAQRALHLIDVEYEELPPVLDPVSAMAPDAPLLHPGVVDYPGLPIPLDAPSNVLHQTSWGKGDLEAGFAAAELIVENTFTTPTVHQAYMEPHCCLVDIDTDGRVQVWAPAKAPYSAKAQIAHAISFPPEQIVLNPVTIGGDFGGKGSPMNIPLTYFLAKAAGRPVRMVFDYFEEFMAANPRHPSIVTMRTGVRHDGSITAHSANVIFDSGGYAGFKPLGFLPGAAGAAGPYRMDSARITASMVYTNNVPCGHMRGPGEPQAIFAVESQMDCVARAIGMDPFAFRRKNLIVDGDETPVGRKLEELRGVETLEAAGEAAGYHDPKPANVGRGVALGDRTPGGGETYAWVTLDGDGTVVVSTTIFEQGSGSYTTLQQVVADQLGLSAERVAYRVRDTDTVSFDSGVGGSRVTRVGTQAAFAAAEDVKRNACQLAAKLLGWPLEQLSLEGDSVVRADTGEAQPWAPLVTRTGEAITGSAHVQDTAPSPIVGFTCQIAEVAVDTQTGEVTLLRLTTAHDTGRIINPMGHQGQINGGVQHGVGYGMMEELIIEDGRVTTLSFGDYKIPTVADMPELRTVLLQSDSGVGPYKIKGIGENPNAPTAAAIANAVADACGVRIADLPVTAEKVYRALSGTN